MGDEDIAEAMAGLRSDPPASIAGITVESVTDFLLGVDERPSYLGATNLIELDLGGVGRVLARPSGTEPKLKIYVDLTTPFPSDGAWQTAEESLSARANQVGESLRSWLENPMIGSESD